MASKRRVAVFGGAFDPPTVNHMVGAAEVVHSGCADEVLIVPCGPRPDKPRLTNAVDRYIMTQLAVNTAFSSDFPVRVTAVEVLQKEALATYDLLNTLSKEQPDCEFSFVIGTDWLQPGTDLRTWTSKDFEKEGELIVTGHKLVSEFDFLVIQRPGYVVDDLASFGPRMRWLVMPDGMTLLEGNLSSTEIRKRTASSYEATQTLQSIEGLVTPAVFAYISRKGLYHSAKNSKVEKQQIPDMFSNLDRNKDGTLAVEDFTQVFAKLFNDALTAEELQTLVVAANAKRNGKIHYMEFLNFVMNEGISPGPARRKVAVFGGAFDPPTLSHVMNLAEALNSGMVDEVVMVPCGLRPDKPQLRPPLTRYTMCCLAVASSFSTEKAVRASDLEVFEPEALATYDALCGLRAQEPGSDFVFVIGSDWLQPGTDIRQWTSKDPVTGGQIVTGDKLLAEFDFLVIKRPGYEVDDLSSFGPRMKWMEMPRGMVPVEANMSSSEVRKRADIDYRLKSGRLELIDGIVPPAVYNYVKREGIYKPGVNRKAP